MEKYLNNDSFSQTEDDLFEEVAEGATIENNQLNKEMEAEDDPGYIKMDWTLETPEKRVAKVNEIIAKTPSERLTPNYLEKLADYIVYAVDKEERKKKKILTENRLVTVNKRETSYEGLIGKLENGEDGIYNMITNDKNVLLDPKKEITQEDLETIPGLKELRESIEAIEAEAKTATGKKKFLLKKQVIEMRQDQYVIKNAFKQPMYSKNLTKTLAKLDLDEERFIDKEGNVHSTGLINFYNPAHVVALLCNYTGLKLETWNKLGSDMKWMLVDFENLIERALKYKYPMYYKLILYKIDGRTNLEIQKLLEEEFGVKHSVEYISSLWRNKIPKLISEQAEIDYLEWYYTFKELGNWKKCSRCGQIKLAHNKFFSKNSTSRDKFYSICKECRNKAAKARRK